MLQFEGYTLDIARNSLRAADREIALRPKSFDLLRYLVENPDRLVTKEELLKAIWPNVVVTDESLLKCVSEVRQAIGDCDQAIIKTIPRRGYRFTAPVSRLTTNAAAAPPTAPPPALVRMRGRVGWSRPRLIPARNRNRQLIGPPSLCCLSPISAATRSRTISATASPRTLRQNCRGSPSSWSSAAILPFSTRARQSISGRLAGSWAHATCSRAASGGAATASASPLNSSTPRPAPTAGPSATTANCATSSQSRTRWRARSS